MRGLPVVSADGVRARRWDAVVLGAALPGLVAAVRLGMHGKRVLVLEEPATRAAYPGLREPFHLTGASGKGFLGTCLQSLGVPPIDRQRFAADPLAYQLLLPELRADLGEASLSGSELVAWGLAKPEEARALLRALGEASAAECEALQASGQAEPARLLSRPVRRPLVGPPPLARSATRHARGLPEPAKRAAPALKRCLAAQLRGLSNTAAAPPSPEACARLLGLALEGGARVGPAETGLHALLRRRIESLFGELRELPEGFRLVSAARQPGIALPGSGELWLGRSLALNAPPAGLAAALGREAPALLATPRASHRRLQLHWRVSRAAAPEGLAPRAILFLDPTREPSGTNLLTLRSWPAAEDPDELHLIASAVVSEEEAEDAAAEAAIEAAVRELMPFSEDRLRRQEIPRWRWDRDDLLADPPAGGAWPSEPEARLSSRPALYSLERSRVAGLGSEGDLLLGWRAGDAMAAEL